MDLPTNFYYFKKGTENSAQLENLIKEQGFYVCQEVITNNYITRHLKNYTFGILHKSPIAQIGQKRKKKTADERLYSYVLYNYEEIYNTISIELLCSRKGVGDGKKLLELVTDRAIEMGCASITLYSIKDEKAMQFYTNNGFKILKESSVFNDDDEIKLYHMVKDLRTMGGGAPPAAGPATRRLRRCVK